MQNFFVLFLVVLSLLSGCANTQEKQTAQSTQQSLQTTQSVQKIEPPILGNVITSCPFTISTPDTYTLNSDIRSSDTCITFAVSGATLDCKDKTIHGAGTYTSSGIVINPGITEVTIKNCVIKDFYNGIWFSQAANKNTITNNKLLDNFQIGISMSKANENIIKDNTLINNGNYAGFGFEIRNSGSNQFINNIITGSETGFDVVFGSENNTFEGNKISSSKTDFYCGGSTNIDKGNTCRITSEFCDWVRCI